MFPIGNLPSALVAYHQLTVAGNNCTDLTKYLAQCASFYHICNDNQRQDQFLIASRIRSNSFGQTATRRGLQSRKPPHDCFRCSTRRWTKRWCSISTNGISPLSIQRIWGASLIKCSEMTRHLVIASRGCATALIFRNQLKKGTHCVAFALKTERMRRNGPFTCEDHGGARLGCA